MRTEMTWRSLLAYFRSSSALHTFHERFPEDKTSVEDKRFLEEDLAIVESGAGANINVSVTLIFLNIPILLVMIDDIRGGDIAIRFWKDLRENALKETPDTKVGAEDIFLVDWPLALILTRKV